MKPDTAMIASMLLVAGCGGDSSVSSSTALTSAPPPTASPTPSPTPTPTAAPTPTPTVTPAPTPTASAATYMKFAEVYIYRLGAGITLPSACSGFEFRSQPPAVLTTTPFGQGLSFRFIITPQVWAIGGDVSISFDGRDGDPSLNGLDVAFTKTIGADTVRFSIAQPVPGVAGLEYTRLASVSAPVQGASRQYLCVVGIPTLAADLADSASGEFRRNTLLATAYVSDGSTARSYSLARSAISVSSDIAGRRVAISLRLVGTPLGAAGPDIDLGSFTASAPIDPATGNFVANLTGTGRPVTGTISGRFFGPQAVEIGAAFGASVADTPTAPGFSFAGTVYGAR